MSAVDEFWIADKRRIAEVGDWDYSWNLYAIFVDKAGRLFSVEDGGCSCYHSYEFPEDLDWVPLDNIQSAIRKAREWHGAENKDIEDFVADLMAYRPVTS